VPFVGVVHEHLDQPVLEASGETRKEFDTDLEFSHDGYAGGLGAMKIERYIPLLREELRRRPGQIYYEVKLACSLVGARSPDAPAALQALGDRLIGEQDRDEQEVAVATAAGSLLQAIPDSELRTARTDALIRCLRGWFPNSPPVAWFIAHVEIRRGDLAAALRYLVDLEKMVESGVYDSRTTCPAAILGIGLWTNLAIVAHQLGRKDVARRNYRRILAVDPANAVARKNIALL
jgi:hypothetical protein